MEGVTNRQGPEPASDPVRLWQLASARCDREAACDGIGPDQTYRSAGACLDLVRDALRFDLEALGCPTMDDAEVRRCVVAMARQDCGARGAEALAHVEECAASALCSKAGAEN